MGIPQAVFVGLDDGMMLRLRPLLADRCIIPGPHFGTVSELCDSFQACADTPLVFLFRVNSRQDLGQLTLLTDRYMGRPVAAFVEGEDRPAFAIAANRAGASQVVPLPLGADDFGAALDRISLTFFGGPTSRSLVVAVSGAKGGCGATTIAINLAYDRHLRRGGRTLLTEYGAKIGSLAPYLALEPRFTTQNILRDIDRADAFMFQEALMATEERFAVLPAPYHNTRMPQVLPSEVGAFLNLARAVSDVVVLDLACAMDDDYFEILALCDRVVLVGNPDLHSTKAFSLICREMEHKGRGSPPLVVLNHYQRNSGDLDCKRVAQLLGVPRVFAVAYDHRAAREACERARPLRQVARHSKIVKGIEAISRELFPDPEPAARPRGLLARMMAMSWL